MNNSSNVLISKNIYGFSINSRLFFNLKTILTSIDLILTSDKPSFLINLKFYQFL